MDNDYLEPVCERLSQRVRFKRISTTELTRLIQECWLRT